MTPGKLLERGQFDVADVMMLGMAIVTANRVTMRRLQQQRGRGLESAQDAAPMGFGSCEILTLQPCNIVAERRCRRQSRQLAPAQGAVGGEHVVEQ